MSIVPTPSFPSLRSLLERLPEDGDPYTNGALFDDGYAEAGAPVTVIDRPTPMPVVMGTPPVAPKRRSRALLVAPLAFVLGIGATLAVDRALDEAPIQAATASLGRPGDNASASLRLVTKVAIVDATAEAAPPASPTPVVATPIEPAATPIEPAATPIEPAATPIEPAASPIEPAASDEHDATRAALRAALVDETPRSRAFDREAARLAVNASASAAKACGNGELTGGASVTVTFARSGNATSALVSGTLAGTEVGSCIANVMRGTQVPAYEGDLVSVRRVVRIR